MSAKPIVAGTDGSSESLCAVRWAAGEAALRGTSLRVVSAAELMPLAIGGHAAVDYEAVTVSIRRRRDEALAAAVEQAARIAPGLLIDADRLEGAPAHAVTEAGSGALMLVVGSRGLAAFAAMLLGSVSRYAATHAACPVVVVREGAGTARRQIGVGIGDVDEADTVLSYAFEEAALRDASVVAMHAWHTPQFDISRAGQAWASPAAAGFQAEATRQLDGLLAGWREKYPKVPVVTDVVHGHPARALVGLSAQADLVVLGRHAAHHGPGTVLYSVLTHAHGPVATVPY